MPQIHDSARDSGRDSGVRIVTESLARFDSPTPFGPIPGRFLRVVPYDK
jgi:hypothetical protein